MEIIPMQYNSFCQQKEGDGRLLFYRLIWIFETANHCSTANLCGVAGIKYSPAVESPEKLFKAPAINLLGM